jgi:hypothetical protein
VKPKCCCPSDRNDIANIILDADDMNILNTQEKFEDAVRDSEEKLNFRPSSKSETNNNE